MWTLFARRWWYQFSLETSAGMGRNLLVMMAGWLAMVLVNPVIAGEGRGQICKVYQQVGGTRGMQTATRIRPDFKDGRSTWLSAGHGLTPGPVLLQAGDGTEFAGECLSRAVDPDVSLIAGPPLSGTGYELVDGLPDDLVLAGYGTPNGSRHVNCLKVIEPLGRGGEVLLVCAAGRAGSGDSGAPVYVEDRLYGLVKGVDQINPAVQRVVYFVPTRQVQQWLGRQGSYQPICPNGVCPLPPVERLPSTPSPGVSAPAGGSSCRVCAERWAAIEKRLSAQEAAIVQLGGLVAQRESRSLVPGPAGPPGKDGLPGRDGLDGKDGLPGTVSREELSALVRTILEEPPPQPSTEDPVDDRRVLYFTSSEGCDCADTDATARRLKAGGYPITIIDLEPSQTEVRGVPRIFVPKSERTIAGRSNVATFLGLLVP